MELIWEGKGKTSEVESEAIKVYENPNGQLWHGDNLDLMRKLPKNSIDLIYLDPPFNTGRDFGSYQDNWQSLETYLNMVDTRLKELHRVLKPTGSLYLHCDPTASHYIKLVLDAVFGLESYKSEIIWKCTSAHANSKTYGNIHQTIFYYIKSQKFIFNTQFAPYTQEYIDTYYRYKDEDGRRFMSDNLTVPSRNDKNIFEWMGKYPSNKRG